MMSDLQQTPQFLQGYSIGEPIADHNGVVCYPALRDDSDDKYIVKMVSVPQSAVQLAALQLTGVYSSRQDVLQYFHTLAEEVIQEVHTLSMLSRMEGFVPYLASELLEKEDGSGYQIWLLSPYQTSLEQIFSERILTHQEILDLGMDLCAALAAARRAGHLYADLKPGNVFYTPQKDYRIGDIGFIPLSSLKYASLQEKYICEYTAPEIIDAGSQLNSTLDVYALGMILYQAYNGGVLPEDFADRKQPLLPPVYADYEMAQIILTACHSDPASRWQDPTALGQALVQYMQQFGIPEGSIVPPPVSTPELDVGEDFLPESEPLPEDYEAIPELQYIEELEAEVSHMVAENPSMTEDALVNEGISDMLAQADDLISHELPDPVVAPEPVEIPIPDPIVPEELPTVEEAEEDVFLPPEADPEPVEISAEEDIPVPLEPISQEPVPVIPESPVTEAEETEKRDYPIKRWVITGLAILLAVAMILLGVRYYRQSYIQTVDSLVLSCTADSITVVVQSDIDESLLLVTCADAYGNSQTGKLFNGVATFAGLKPNSRYTIRLSISGSHKLVGPSVDTITTSELTYVENLAASIGPVDGSVYLQFSVTGVECDSWVLTYSSKKEASQTVSFVGHAVTVYGLTPGEEYTFQLSAADETALFGETQVNFTARNITRAVNPVITHCGNGSLTVQWNAPANAAVDQWIVRCFDSSGFDETITTDDCFATFQGMSHETACTVEITAIGMPQGVFVSVSPNPIYISDYTHSIENGTILFQWTHTGATPANGWRIEYLVNDLIQDSIHTDECSVLLPYYPGCDYMISLIPNDEIDIFNHTFAFTAMEAASLDAFGIRMADLRFTMCAVPDMDWAWDEIPPNAYKTTFATGETAGFIVQCDAETETPEQPVSICFLFRDSRGNLIQAICTDMLWNEMWNRGNAALTLLWMPETTGEYTVSIYWNGQLAGQQAFQMI